MRTIFIHHKSTERGFNTATKCIVVFCALVIGAAAWLLNRSEHPKESRAEKHGLVRGKSSSTEIVVEGTGDGCSEARTIEKAPSEKERLKAAELLGKRYGLYTEKVDVATDMDLNITIDYGEDDSG